MEDTGTLVYSENINKSITARQQLTQWLSAAALYFAIYSILCCQFQSQELLPYALAGLPVTMIVILRSKRSDFAVKLALLAAIVVLTVIFRRQIVSGAAMLCNRLFEASEAEQAYRYECFEPIISSRSCMKYTACMVGAVLAYGLSLLHTRLRALAGVCSLALMAFCAAYFGVVPSAWACLLLLLAAAAQLVLANVHGNGSVISDIAMLAAALALIAGLIFIAFPDESPRISELDEQIRDSLAAFTAHIDPKTVYVDEETEQPQDEPDDNRSDSADDEDSSGAGAMASLKILLIALFVLLLALILFVPAVILDRINKKRELNRKDIGSREPNVAVCAMFRYTVSWLYAFGMERSSSYKHSTQWLFNEMPEGYAEKFLNLHELWQEAAFSDHAIDRKSADKMHAFMEETVQMLWSGAKLKKRLEIKYKYAL